MEVGIRLSSWSGIDYLLERRKFESDLRMSRQEMVDEFKETEGNPAVKARIRRLQRQVRRRRMLQDVERATVVITNPTEFAVALEFSPLLSAPVVVAKGRNLLAAEIKQVARWHGIPLVENPPLAHTLYRAVEIGQSIPPKLYQVVAEVLAAIYRVQAQVSGARPEEAGMAAVIEGAVPGRNSTADWIVPIAAVGMVFIMLVPVPAFLLDLLLATSITASVLVLLAALNILRPAQFSVFPSLLLLLTLFRLSLNLASSRPHSAARQ